MTTATIIKENTYSFRDLVRYPHCGHGSVHVDLVLEKEMRVLHLYPQTTEEVGVHTGYRLSIGDLKDLPDSDTLSSTGSHLLKIGQIS